MSWRAERQRILKGAVRVGSFSTASRSRSHHSKGSSFWFLSHFIIMKMVATADTTCFHSCFTMVGTTCGGRGGATRAWSPWAGGESVFLQPKDPTWKSTPAGWGIIFSFHRAQQGPVVGSFHIMMQKCTANIRSINSALAWLPVMLKENVVAGVASSFNPDGIEVLLVEVMLSLVTHGTEKDLIWLHLGRLSTSREVGNIHCVHHFTV